MIGDDFRLALLLRRVERFPGMTEGTGSKALPVTLVVGGGIAGLYAAYLLGRAGYPVTVLEQGSRWGGRIESIKLPPGQDEQFIAEFGPMRFEPGLQERLVTLARHLGIEFTPFAPTTAPACPTDYEVSDLEASFRTAAELLLWAVLRMFFGTPSSSDGAAMDGPQQLAALRAHLDRRFDQGYDEAQAWLDELRQTQRLEGRTEESAPLLRDLGLWNALSEVITPGALAMVRDSGTFYHFISHNPNAAEWGIFWLRQAATRGLSIETFSRESAPAGVATLVERLVERIEAECPSVTLLLRQRAVSVGQAKHPGEVEVTIEDETGPASRGYSLRADHVILALPQSALRRLAGNFPDDVRRNVEDVLPLPMLKAFLVTSKPWWGHHVEAHSHAWLVPTRELHYYTLPEDPGCALGRQVLAGGAHAGECSCGPVRLGMVMLYTDIPAIDYWKPFIAEEEQPGATLYGAGDAPRLKRALVRQLLVEANPLVAEKIDLQRRRVEYELIERLDALGARLAQEAHAGHQPLSSVLRAYAETASAEERAQLEAVFVELFGGDDGWVQALLEEKPSTRTKEELTADYLDSVVAFGIHDWSKEPFGGAAHCWRPGADSVGARQRLAAFGLRGRPDAKNIHVCGEAYSGFQGFIEGSLATAEDACRRIVPDLALDLPPR
jgi:monoamine oxidase